MVGLGCRRRCTEGQPKQEVRAWDEAGTMGQPRQEVRARDEAGGATYSACACLIRHLHSAGIAYREI